MEPRDLSPAEQPVVLPPMTASPLSRFTLTTTRSKGILRSSRRWL
jgi:hypothetical protein